MTFIRIVRCDFWRYFGLYLPYIMSMISWMSSTDRHAGQNWNHDVSLAPISANALFGWFCNNARIKKKIQNIHWSSSKARSVRWSADNSPRSELHAGSKKILPLAVLGIEPLLQESAYVLWYLWGDVPLLKRIHFTYRLKRICVRIWNQKPQRHVLPLHHTTFEVMLFLKRNAYSNI